MPTRRRLLSRTDGLAEFISVVDAANLLTLDYHIAGVNAYADSTNCAVEIQGTLKAENQILSPGRGYGDGVEVAALLDSLADPGRHCVQHAKVIFRTDAAGTPRSVPHRLPARRIDPVRALRPANPDVLVTRLYDPEGGLRRPELSPSEDAGDNGQDLDAGTTAAQSEDGT
jgi:hypothetical protein